MTTSNSAVPAQGLPLVPATVDETSRAGSPPGETEGSMAGRIVAALTPLFAIAAGWLAGLAAPAVRGGLRSTTWLRRAWTGHAGEKTARMVPLRLLGRPPTPVHPYTVDAWRAMERALTATGYRPHSVWNYSYRQITAGTGLSLHAYGLATDIDPDCNPFRLTPRQPVIRFSPKPDQEQRCADVKAQLADTAFTPEQVAAVEAITTLDGLQVIAWGGRWRSIKDAMHFQINLSPEELRRGLRLN